MKPVMCLPIRMPARRAAVPDKRAAVARPFALLLALSFTPAFALICAPAALRASSPLAPVRKRSVLPWHWWQPLAAASGPSMTSPITLSSEPMNWAALAWCEACDSAASPSWQSAQSLGVTTVAISWPSCWKASGSPASAAWHSRQPIPARACFEACHWAATPGVFWA